MTASASRTARARARDELTREIKEAARRRLAQAGSAELSLRAVARDLGLAPSAVYRYFPSRDDLLTALIIDAFDAVGAVAEQADAVCERGDITGRWLAVARAVRAWALANRHEYTLVYGTPVPGYRAPQDTIGHATRITDVLLGILRDAAAAGGLADREDVPLPDAVHADLSRLRMLFAPEVTEPALARGLMAWMLLFGTISFEMFGHLYNVVADYDAFFEHEMRQMAVFIGLDRGPGR